MTKRVLVCEFHQESNTFNPIPVPLALFTGNCCLEGQALYDVRKGEPCAVHGAIDAIEQAGGQVVPGISLSITSGGRLEDEVLALVMERTEHYLRGAGEIDGVYLSLHGATCTVSQDDACGAYLEFVRSLVGDKPIAASCDLHANVTERMLCNADYICGYQTYPHVDFYETGRRAAGLCMARLAGERPVMATVHVPMMVPPAGYSTLDEPFKGVIDAGKGLVEDGTLLDFTVFNVQPWLDIPHIASTAVAIGKDEQSAKEQAEVLAQKLFDAREGCWPELMSVDEVIDAAETNTTGKVIVLADAADSTNGGAVGDSPAVALRLLERGSRLRAALFVKDPAAVKHAFSVGVGGRAEFSVGAGYTPDMPGPLKAEGVVLSLHDGHFIKEGPAGRGESSYIGLAAVIRFGTVDILVCDTPSSSGDPQHFRHFGIEPTLYDLVVVKANTSFRVPYGAFAGRICYADTPGAGASDLKRFRWNALPKGFYPFDLPDGYRPGEAKVW